MCCLGMVCQPEFDITSAVGPVAAIIGMHSRDTMGATAPAGQDAEVHMTTQVSRL
jgi:hypothetical protein